jgi:hypothetical protein
MDKKLFIISNKEYLSTRIDGFVSKQSKSAFQKNLNDIYIFDELMARRIAASDFILIYAENISLEEEKKLEWIISKTKEIKTTIVYFVINDKGNPYFNTFKKNYHRHIDIFFYFDYMEHLKYTLLDLMINSFLHSIFKNNDNSIDVQDFKDIIYGNSEGNIIVSFEMGKDKIDKSIRSLKKNLISYGEDIPTSGIILIAICDSSFAVEDAEDIIEDIKGVLPEDINLIFRFSSLSTLKDKLFISLYKL